MKVCSTCKKNKLLSEYHTNKGTPKSYCKECAKKYRKSYYDKNREYAIQYAMKSSTKKKQLLRNYVFEYLKTHPCVDCNEDDPIVLEFDHIDPKVKINNISQLVLNKVALCRLQTEIDKCEVRCCNCHRRKTARDGKFVKFYENK